MSKTLLIIIYGPPCTGKTTIGNRISQEFNLPYINKDNIKESLFDTLGSKDREWSKKLGFSSIKLLFYFLESLLSKNVSIIAEDVFYHESDKKRFIDLKNKYNFIPFEIRCKTNGKILFERFKNRSESGKRHPGHVDQNNYEEFKDDLLRGENEPLNIGGKVFDIDTTDFNSIEYDNLFNAIKSATILTC